jgi:ribonuclease HI
MVNKVQKVYVDGAANMNIKRCGIGVVFEDEIITEEIAYGTNNDAEYLGLICALERGIERGLAEIDVYMDSKLVVQQVKGNWRINFPHLLAHNNRVKELGKQIKFSVSHVRREFNDEADYWSKYAIGKTTKAMDRKFLNTVEDM